MGGLLGPRKQARRRRARIELSHARKPTTTPSGNAGRRAQVQGKDRARVAEVAAALGLDGSYIARSYIEQVQLLRLTDSFQSVTEDMKAHFALNGESLIDGPPGGSPRRAGGLPFSQSMPARSSTLAMPGARVGTTGAAALGAEGSTSL